jgi:hypothetical protein
MTIGKITGLQKSLSESIKTEYKTFDYEFVFKINDDIICSRYFNINGFQSEHLLVDGNLKHAVDDVVDVINADLTEKSRVYMWYTCSSRDNTEQEKGREIELTSSADTEGNTVVADYNDFWVVDQTPAEFIPLPERKDIYDVELKESVRIPEIKVPVIKCRSVDGVKTYLPYVENYFSFSFRVRNVPVITKIWSADDYPKFIRSNVDLANKKVYLGVNESQAVYELRKKIFDNRKDLIPTVISILKNALSE